MRRKRFQTKRTVKRVSAMVLMVSLMLLCACAEPLELYVPDDAAVYTSEDAAVLLKDAMQWNMTHLVQHELYIKDDTLYMDCLFDKAVDAGEIDRMRSFVITAFVLLHCDALGPTPYSELVMDRNRGELMWESVVCRIYQGSELVYEDVHDLVYDRA